LSFRFALSIELMQLLLLLLFFFATFFFVNSQFYGDKRLTNSRGTFFSCQGLRPIA